MSSETDPGTAAGASWPPAPEGQPRVPTVAGGGAEEALHHGWRLLVLGVFVPVVFLPLTVWQGIAASRARPGAGTPLLLAGTAVAALWVGALLFLWFQQGE